MEDSFSSHNLQIKCVCGGRDYCLQTGEWEERNSGYLLTVKPTVRNSQGLACSTCTLDLDYSCCIFKQHNTVHTNACCARLQALKGAILRSVQFWLVCTSKHTVPLHEVFLHICILILLTRRVNRQKTVYSLHD